jgi:hypothetical protein
MTKPMKKLFASILVSLGMIVALPATTLAASAKTDITGTVTNNGHVVSGAKVTVVCGNNAKTDTSDSSGAYLVTFTVAKCPVGSVVHVTAKKGKLGGYSQKTVTATTTKLNVAVVNVALPELGWTTGAGALLVAGGAFTIVRRRQMKASHTA